jgi:hypothetical protein
VDKHVDNLEGLKINRYQQVIVASKYARILNKRSEKEKSDGQTEEKEPDKQARISAKVVTEALKALKDGRIEWQEPDETKDK